MNTINDPFEQIRHMQVQMTKLYSPLFMKQLEGISKSISIFPMMNQYQQQFALIGKGFTTPISDQFLKFFKKAVLAFCAKTA